jgi:hypothetical protein
MWPYTNEEASWLTPPAEAERPRGRSANDNDPARHVTAGAPVQQACDRKSPDET